MGPLGSLTGSVPSGCPIALILEAQVGCASLVKPGPSGEWVLWVGHEHGPLDGLFALPHLPTLVSTGTVISPR